MDFFEERPYKLFINSDVVQIGYLLYYLVPLH
jgi:hypothetical protein